MSSVSKSWLMHSEKYVELVMDRLELDWESQVTEIACNDGYLLQYFHNRGIPCIGVEPATSVARIAVAKGLPVIEDFFGVRLAEELIRKGKRSDLVIGNNVVAHVPDLSDFVDGLKLLLKPAGTITLEFPYLISLIDGNQFDTIYHEHFSYFSFGTIRQILNAHGLEVYDVERLPTHGGSLRIYARHLNMTNPLVGDSVTRLLSQEEATGVRTIEYYENFGERVARVKTDFLGFLLDARRRDKTVCGYGAAAKGNTLINYCGVRSDLIHFVVDAAPSKQGLFLPGSHIPVVTEDVLKSAKPDFIIILPWNIRDEILEQLHYVRDWGGKFVVLVPELKVM